MTRQRLLISNPFKHFSQPKNKSPLMSGLVPLKFCLFCEIVQQFTAIHLRSTDQPRARLVYSDQSLACRLQSVIARLWYGMATNLLSWHNQTHTTNRSTLNGAGSQTVSPPVIISASSRPVTGPRVSP